MISYKKIMWAIMNNGADILVSMGIFMLISKFYTPTDLGIWTLFTAGFYIVTKIRESLIQSALVKFSVGKEKKEHYEALKASFITNLVLDITITSIILLVQLFITSPALNELLLFYPIYSLSWAIFRWQLIYLRAELKVELIFKANLVFVFVLMIGILKVISDSFPLYFMVLLLAIASTSSMLYLCFQIPIYNILSANSNKKTYYQMINFGKYGFFRDLLGLLSGRINVFIIAAFLSLPEAALLGVASKFNRLIAVPNTAVQSLFYSKACAFVNQNNINDLRKLFIETVSRLLGVLLLMAILISLFSKQAIILFSTSEYLEAIPLLILMVFTSAIVLPFGNAFGSVINALNKPRLNAKVVTGISLLNILLLGICTPLFGLIGVGIAPLLANIIGIFWTQNILLKELEIKYLKCFLGIIDSYRQLYFYLNQYLKQKIFQKI